MADWETASHCPKCDAPGEEGKTVRITSGRLRGGNTIVMTCRNERCKWFNTSWVVSVGPNGEIPERPIGMKEFPALTPGEEAYARMVLEQVALQDPLARRELDRLAEDNG